MSFQKSGVRGQTETFYLVVRGRMRVGGRLLDQLLCRKIMRFHIEWAETKGEGWKVVTAREAIEGGREYSNCSVNKVDRAGVVAFPDFDKIAPGYEFEADFWENKANGKRYLFAPKPRVASNSAPRGASTATRIQMIEKEQKNIEKNMDRKEMSIRVRGAMSDATSITTALMEGGQIPMDEENVKSVWRGYRDFFLKEYDKATDIPFI